MAKAEFTNEISDERSLIVLAAPRAKDSYYRAKYEDILAFQVDFARKIMGNDNVIILCDKKALKKLRKNLPADVLLQESMKDIWMRDFTTAIPHAPVQFRYTASAQGGSRRRSKRVQAHFNKFAEKYGLQFRQTKWEIDGGNIVDNDHSKAIVTTRFLEDNKLGYKTAKKELKEILKVKKVAIIPSDDDEGLAHADGMVMFLGLNSLAINRYEGGFRKSLRQELKESFPKIKIVEVESHYAEDEFDERMSSATGIYTNGLVTDRNIYLPLYGLKTDKATAKKIRRNTKKKVITVNASGVSAMGGSVRCLSWQLKGKNAHKLILAARASQE